MIKMNKLKKKKCPKCGMCYEGYPAISRRDNKTEICSTCGVVEALEDFRDSQICRASSERKTYIQY